jgi:DNA-binding response OmpR family regulator
MSQRILVVDDSATIRRVAQRTLREAGYEVILAVDGRDALEKMQSVVPDLALVDFVMPHMNGLRFVQAMRQIANLAAVPIVLMSAKADKIGEGFVAQTGAMDAITKPFSAEALLAVTGNALSRAQSASRDTELPAPPISVEHGVLSPLPSALPTSETSPAALSAALRAIAERMGRLAGEADASIDGSALADRIADHFEPRAVFEIVRELHTLVPGHDGERSLEGSMEHVPLGDVLQLLQHQRQTGVLDVHKQSTSGRSVSICLRDGDVQLALGNVDEQEFRLGRYVLREGIIDKTELDRIVRNRSEPRGLLGTQLLKLGYLSADELTRVLMRQTSELIYEALRWRRGRYVFLRFASRPEANDARLGLPVAAVLMEGLRRVDEWRLIEEQIRSFDDVPRRDEEALLHVDQARWSADERRVLDAVDGQRSVREIIEQTRMASFDASKILFQLLTSRLLRVQRADDPLAARAT